MKKAEPGWLRWFFPYGYICQVPLEQVRQGLIETFLRYGQCGAMRVDNGEPLGSTKPGLTSALALWLIGMDVKMIFNKPRCPQQNAKVERMQATSARWAEIESCPNAQVLQERLNQESVFQRNSFPVSRLGKQTRVQAFPELEACPRPFAVDGFDPHRVYRFLASKVYVRLVSKNGQLNQFGKRFYLGKAYAGQYVHLRFDPDKCHWDVYAHSRLIQSFQASNLTKERIQNLTIYANKPNSMS